MINKYTFSKLVFLTCITMSASTIDTIEVPQGNVVKFPSIFERIVNESESYKDLKLIKNSDLELIKTANNNDILEYKRSVLALEESVRGLKSELEAAKKNPVENNDLSEITDSSRIPTIVYFGIIALLTLLLLIYYFQNKKIKESYKLHKSNLVSTEEEFDEFKRSAIERELKLKREIMDVRNLLNSANKTDSKSKTSKN